MNHAEKIFGEKKAGVDYRIRKAGYAIIWNESKDEILVVKNEGYYFLPGGGMEGAETIEECLCRELLEETGYLVSIDHFVGCAGNYFFSRKSEPLYNEGYFYEARLLEYRSEPLEEDHIPEWLHVAELEGKFFHEHHVWAVNKSKEKNSYLKR